ncbi:branched-chain amino acid ABC transporter substrate-binding protein [Litchfieldella anticariensis FP35 = DSM 16096]|uniref:Branched-chain amino acid ABC transporter substrate-binding protein n=1 Tax=Litchfieldella anticariensis (strain DSM 16096 / CECT 5854 / CIP 108499 / LMG 22089 / FP35) TaxID=1121939 RepID=S2LAY2_LITA3|nr:ABC transporter ATP-binding protein [Halomonas anticariensis]EPC01856.1 branched-chain amino acid ABC transporter substrate-binding protein [Halomonas anticariensis FP35 = DSM 16096]
MSDAVLTLSHLHKSFGALQATQDISLDLRAGEIHALIGPNGAGKSTLIGQITGHLTPDRGKVQLAGENITALSVAQRARRGLGRSFQVSSLADSLSVLRNVMIAVQGLQGHSFRFWKPVHRDASLVEPARAAIARMQLESRAETPVSELSHGERRQVEVACALALKPRALLLDEPMAGLGPEGSARLTELLEELKHEVPILLIEHDMDAVFRLADRISVLVAGQMIAHGVSDEIRANPLVREAYLGD